MKKLLIYMVTLCLCSGMFILSSCDQQLVKTNKTSEQISNSAEEQLFCIIDQDIVLMNDLDTEYNYDQLCELRDQNVSMEEFIESLGIAKIKKIHNMTYTVLKSNEGFLLISFYPSDEKQAAENASVQDSAIYREVLIRKIQFSDIMTQSFFDTIQSGMSVDEILISDPDGGYDFLNASWSQFPQYSYHFFEDGKALLIQYENSLVAKVIRFTL